LRYLIKTEKYGAAQQTARLLQSNLPSARIWIKKMNNINEIEHLVEKFEQKKMTRRELVASLLVATTASAVPCASAQTATPVAIGRSMNHVSLSVNDVNRSADFYNRVLGMEIISRPANGGLNMGLGSESFLGLYNLPNPGGMHHMCIGVDDYNPDALAEKLQDHGIDADVNRDAANRTSGGDQLYFTDPDGIRVQLAQHGYLG
jgi:catechol 2,3-dioxygenase-like lactoylglutathione lyase family enzyme